MQSLLSGARSMDGKYVVAGDVGRQSGAVSTSLDVLEVRSGRVVFSSGPVSGPTLEGALSRAAIEVGWAIADAEGLRLSAREDLRSLTTSATALGLLLKARMRFWEGDDDAAAHSLRSAIEADSDFALAYHRLSIAEVFRHVPDRALATLEVALQRAESFADEWRQLLEAQRYAVMGQGDSAAMAFQVAVADEPGNIDGWLGLGDVLFHYAGFGGHTALEAMSPLEQVAARDSQFAPIYAHLVDLAMLSNDAGSPSITSASSPSSPLFSSRISSSCCSSAASWLSSASMVSRSAAK